MVKGHGAYTLNEVTTVYKMYLKGSTFLVQPFYMIILVWLGVFSSFLIMAKNATLWLAWGFVGIHGSADVSCVEPIIEDLSG